MIDMRSSDTSPEADAVQLEVYRRLGAEGRVELALRMSEEARATTRAGIRDRHPEYSEEEVRYAFFRLIHGDELFRKAWPEAPLLSP